MVPTHLLCHKRTQAQRKGIRVRAGGSSADPENQDALTSGCPYAMGCLDENKGKNDLSALPQLGAPEPSY